MWSLYSIMQYTISPRNRLEVTLRFLATGETYRSLMYQTRIHESTISRIVPEVCSAIIKHLRTNLKPPCTVDEWRNIAKDFNALWNFPHCLGALDDGSYYYNYKGEHIIVLLAMSDAHYRFIYFNLGINGRVSDGGVYQASYLPRAIEKNELHFPNPEALPGRNTKVPYVIVADDAFPLSKHLLSRARRIIENAFGILCNRFRVLLNPINLSAAKVEIVTLACVALHNYLLKDVIVHPDAVAEPLPTNLTKVGIQGGNKSSLEARNIRDEFKAYFNSDQGKVDWQENSIERHNL
ncbi:hypothetical protein RI129_002923 [Pyrocoelia pectoralis]|uniref:DDE Tnp4 domain-containing protein n=1 Tax=Pyrocoelia pectoralis TaxID=417401 RepID=A0AAN7VMW0_9COLE